MFLFSIKVNCVHLFIVGDSDNLTAIKLLVSTDSLAKQDVSTFQKLKEKHPSPGRHLNLPEAPDNSITAANATTMDVYDSIYSFPNGSSSGIDGIRPQHLKDLVAKSNSDAAPKLLQSITNLENLMLSGKVLSTICPIQ